MIRRILKPLSSLKYKSYRYLFLGSALSWVGTQMQVVAVIWHLYKLTNSPYSLAIIGLSRFIPLMILSPLAGLIADKYNRKKIMFIAQIIAFSSSSLLTYLTFTNLITPLQIYLFVALDSIASTLLSPSRQSILPSLVPKEALINALGLNSIMYQISLVLGPSIGGFILASTNIWVIYLINSLSFIPVMLSILALKNEPRPHQTTTSLSLKSMREGFIFVFSHPLIASTMLLDFFATFFSSATVLLPIFAKEILHVGPQGLGILFAAPSIGAIIAGWIFSSFKELKSQGKILLMAVTVYGLATILFGLSTSFYWAFFFLALTGAGDVVSAIIRNAIRQLATPDHMRGRMTAVNMIFYTGGPQLGEVEAGILAGFAGLRQSVIIGGISTILFTIITYALVPKLRNYQNHAIDLT